MVQCTSLSTRYGPISFPLCLPISLCRGRGRCPLSSPCLTKGRQRIPVTCRIRSPVFISAGPDSFQVLFSPAYLMLGRVILPALWGCKLSWGVARTVPTGIILARFRYPAEASERASGPWGISRFLRPRSFCTGDGSGLYVNDWYYWYRGLFF